MGLYVMPKLIELIKDPAVDSRTNSTPFVIGETVTGLRSGVRLRVVAPNDVYKFNPYTDEELPSSYASTTAFLNIDLDSLAAQLQVHSLEIWRLVKSWLAHLVLKQ